MRDDEERGAKSASGLWPKSGWYQLPPPTWQPSGRELSLVERALLAVLEHHIRKVGKPLGIEELVKLVGVGRTAVIDARARLERDRILAVEKGGGKGQKSTHRWGPILSGSRTESHADTDRSADSIGAQTVRKTVPSTDSIDAQTVRNPDTTPSYSEGRGTEGQKGSRAQTRAPAPAPALTHARESLASLTADAETVRAELEAAHRKHRRSSPPRELVLGTSHHPLVIDIAKQCRDDAKERGTTVADEIARRAYRWAATRWRNGDWSPLRDLASNPANYLNDTPPERRPSGLVRGAPEPLPKREEYFDDDSEV